LALHNITLMKYDIQMLDYCHHVWTSAERSINFKVMHFRSRHYYQYLLVPI